MRAHLATEYGILGDHCEDDMRVTEGMLLNNLAEAIDVDYDRG